MIQKSSDRRIFEALCLEPEKRGFSYDPVLLVDVDHAFDFDEAVIRLTTKCNSIVTQLRTLGHHVEEFSVMSSKVGAQMPKSPSSSKAESKEEVSSPETRNLKVMEDKWKVMKRKNYSGMVAVARISRSSIPRNGSGGKYSVHTFTQALMNHIQAYFMFQSYNADFVQWMSGGPYELEDADEYLVYLVYRIHHTTPVRGKKRGLSEVDKLESWGMYSPASRRRRRYTSGESSLSSSSIGSSASSTPSGGPAILTAPVTRSALRTSVGSTDMAKPWDHFSPPIPPIAPSPGSASSRPSTPSQPSTPKTKPRRSKSPDSDSTLLAKNSMSLRRRSSFHEGSSMTRRSINLRPRRKLLDQQAPHTD
ncbi:hypothetical protein SK128_003206 [Halocaridina rubra]|uniref:Uncharacterized protein n=1 Tax=Halocaridina rubra TaxID=373956 RepID=A0AAN9A5C3_HALRR